MPICADSRKDIYECSCSVCLPLRRLIKAQRERRARAAWKEKSPPIVRRGETDRRLKDALTALPPSDRD